MIAEDREPDEACQKGTVGCCIDHPSVGPETSCETW